MLVRYPVSNFRLFYEVLALFASVLVFSVYLLQKRYIIPGLFIILCAFTAYYPITTLTSINALVHVIPGMLLFYIISASQIPDKCFYNMFCVYCLVHVAFIIAAKLGTDLYMLYGIKTNMSVTGITANPNEAAALLSLCVPCFFRSIWWIALPVIFVCVVLVGPLSGFLSFALIAGAWLMFEGRWYSAVAICFFLLLLGISIVGNCVYDESLSEKGFFGFIYNLKPDKVIANIKHQLYSSRRDIWIKAIKFYFKETFYTGFGLGHWSYMSKKYLKAADATIYMSRAHNTFIQCFFEMGMPFLLLLGFYVKSLISKAKNNRIYVYALIAIFVSCSVNSAFRINALNGTLIIIWLALIGRGHGSKLTKHRSY